MSLKNDRLLQDASALNARGDIAGAARVLRQLLRREPTHLAALTRLAEIEIEWEQFDTAIERLQKVLRIGRGYAPAFAALAKAYWLSGNVEQAFASAVRNVELDPSDARNQLLLAQLHHRRGDRQQARTMLEDLIARASSDRQLLAELHTELAREFELAGEYGLAIEHYEAATKLDPSWVDTHFGYAETLLRLGSYAKGWSEFALCRPTRYARRGLPPVPPEYFWDGKENLAGQKIVVVDDAGFGDAVQFFRYVPKLQAMGAKIVYRALPPLVPLFQSAAPYAEFISDLNPGFRFNYICLSYDLPGLFRTSTETVPHDVPYLSADPARIQRWAPELGEHPGPRIGVAWAGNAKYVYDYQRSMSADVFLRIADTPAATFYSLQHDIKPEDAPSLAAHPNLRRIGEQVADFADTAAIVSQLDMVITTDTALAHLAGALGKPVWLLLGSVPAWRWLLDREDSPWYPTMRLFRQSQPGDWNDVVQRVCHALERSTN